MKPKNLARLIPSIPEMGTWQAAAVSLVLHGGIFYAIYNWDFDREAYKQENPPTVPISMVFTTTSKTTLTPDKPEPAKLADASPQTVKQPVTPATETTKETTQTPSSSLHKQQETRQKPVKKATAKPHKKAKLKLKSKKTVQPEVSKQQNYQSQNVLQKPVIHTSTHPSSGSIATTGKVAAQQKRPAPTNVVNSVTLSPPQFKAAYLHNPKPPYPRVSRRLGETGQVLLLVQVSDQGTASQVSLKKSSGFTRLDQSAMQTVRTWKFVPAKRGTTNIAAPVVVPIRFTIND